MKAAVYNRFWSTGGGAETYGGALAQLLATRGEVELLAHEPIDTAALGERLALDLSGCAVRVLPQLSTAITAASADADLFVNVSHRSRDAPASGKSLYVVHFPTSLGPARGPATGVPRIEWGPGFHGQEGRTTWTDGAGTLLVTTEPGRPVELTVLLGFARPAAAGATEVQLLVDGRRADSTRLAAARTPLDRWSGRALRARVVSPAPGVPAEVTVASDVFVPREVLGNDDDRVLGVPVVGLALGASVGARLTRNGVLPTTSTRWLDRYDAIVANSAFTAGWVERLWGRPSTVLHPPVPMRTGGSKERIVLGVGRFFPRERGHSKKQLELVQAFRALVDGGLDGWSLHLVGGCSDTGRDYLESVRAAAAGYSVRLHPNAPGHELDDLYARASVFWHAAGLGEDPGQHPDRFEHFGISTVEAMSAGAVPVVLGAGGLVETVRDGIDGFHAADLEDFVTRTRELASDPARLQALSASAEQRAQQFSLPAFDGRLQELLDSLSVSG